MPGVYDDPFIGSAAGVDAFGGSGVGTGMYGFGGTPGAESAQSGAFASNDSSSAAGLASFSSNNFWNNITGITDQMRFNDYQALLQRNHTTEERIATQLYNSAEAQKAREWQERMDANAVQRRMNDLAAAGINPLYMFMGSGAGIGSSGGGSAASVSAGNSSAASSGASSSNVVASIIGAIAKIVAAAV